MKHLRRAIEQLAQQKEYPTRQIPNPYTSRDTLDIPEPITKTTLGAFGVSMSVSTTNYENAKLYKEGIKFVVGVVNEELSWQDIVQTVGNFGATQKDIYGMLALKMKDDYASYEYRNFGKHMGEVFGKDMDEWREISKARDEFWAQLPAENEAYSTVDDYFRSEEGKAWLINKALNQEDYYGNAVAHEDDIKRRWNFLKGVAYASKNLPVVIGAEIPEHLRQRKMSDVGIIEVAVAPSDWSKNPPGRDEDSKGKYTYHFEEQEWRHYDVTDLWPVRIVARSWLLTAAEKLDDLPPPSYVYHATPYAQEILSSGFEIKPERQTFGGHGKYVSVTTYENAMAYAKDLKIVVGFLSGELSWGDLESIAARRGLGKALGASAHNRGFNELVYNFKDTWKELVPSNLDTESHNIHTPEWYAWFLSVVTSGKDFDGRPLSTGEEISRRWAVLKGLNPFSSGKGFTYFVGSDPPAHLLSKSMDDVKVVKIAVAPAKPYEERGWKPNYWSREEGQDPKGVYTYNAGEHEWRFYDTTDLWPVEAIEVPL